MEDKSKQDLAAGDIAPTTGSKIVDIHGSMGVIAVAKDGVILSEEALKIPVSRGSSHFPLNLHGEENANKMASMNFGTYDKGVIVKILTPEEVEALTPEEKAKRAELVLDLPTVYPNMRAILNKVQDIQAIMEATSRAFNKAANVIELRNKSPKGRQRILRMVQRRVMTSRGEDRRVLRGILKVLKKHYAQQTSAENIKRWSTTWTDFTIASSAFSTKHLLKPEDAGLQMQAFAADQHFGMHVFDERGVLGFVPGSSRGPVIGHAVSDPVIMDSSPVGEDGVLNLKKPDDDGGAGDERFALDA